MPEQFEPCEREEASAVVSARPSCTRKLQSVPELRVKALAKGHFANATVTKRQGQGCDLRVDRGVDRDRSDGSREADGNALAGIERGDRRESACAKDGRGHRELVEQRVGRVAEPQGRHVAVTGSIDSRPPGNGSPGRRRGRAPRALRARSRSRAPSPCRGSPSGRGARIQERARADGGSCGRGHRDRRSAPPLRGLRASPRDCSDTAERRSSRRRRPARAEGSRNR